ncbi:class I adenylate-forming enzyme family protein [Abyssisolibacter fermentans]|uniref:class I adenylate-forming enzyme family protein n=1 Tax=Abyssisolibacter fermentans TaxID=1766203 RepID=UPI00082C91E3|nr:class I adenylate-forming enzyme family protein [Abyssisolibacter fermentans]
MDILNVTLSDVLKKNAEDYPEDIAYIFDDVSYNWKQVDQITDIIATMMLKKNIQKGTHVGVWSINSFQQVCIMYAAMKIGAVTAVFNYSYKHLEMKNVLSYADIEYLFYGESTGSIDYLKIINKVNKGLPKLKDHFSIISIFNEATELQKSDDATVWQNIEKLNKVKRLVTTEDTACMLFTSGSTQLPKGVLLSYYSILNDARVLSDLMRWNKNKDTMLIGMPIFHCSGMTCGLLLGLMVGMPTIIMRKYKSDQAMRLIEKYRVTAFNVVPSMLMLLAEDPSFGNYNISSWNSGILAGSGMTGEKYRELISKVDVPHLQIGYGQTETSPLITLSDYDDDTMLKSETIGKAIPNMEIRIWDNEANRECDVNVKGEIQTKGFCIMKGYYNMHRKNLEKYTHDGWLKTDDVGYRDKDDYFYFCGRASDMIVRGGENISPSEIECVIGHYSEDILNVKVVGVDIGTAVQEEIVALITMKPDKKIDADGLKDFVKNHLASYKTPNFIFQLDEFLMNSTGKIDLVSIKKLARDNITKMLRLAK